MVNDKDEVNEVEQKIKSQPEIKMKGDKFREIHRNLMEIADEENKKHRKERWTKKLMIGFGSAASLVLAVLLLFSLNGVPVSDRSMEENESAMVSEEAAMEMEKADLFQYKNTYVGDNSTILNIVRELQYSEKLDEISLKTETEPYGITVEYEDPETGRREAALYNTTFLLALVPNADWVTIYYGDAGYAFTREKLEEWYGTSLSSFTSEEELDSFIKRYVEDEETLRSFFEDNQ